jgi:hypothetical protein
MHVILSSSVIRQRDLTSNASAAIDQSKDFAMPLEYVPGSALTYYLIPFDAAGRERTTDSGEKLSERAVNALGTEPITDVFLMSHGWKGDMLAAREQYGRWIGAMAQCADDLARMQQVRPGFRPLLIGLHWPSLPYGDERLGDDVSFAVASSVSVEPLIEQAAARIADTPAARAALRTIFTAADDDLAPPSLPPEVRKAYEVLDQEAALGGEGVAAAPGADREPFDPERFYQAAQEEEVSFGVLGLGGILSLLQQLSFWKMKDRARQFGETDGHTLLTTLQHAAGTRNVRFHLMGDSFGCIVMSATLAGPGGRGKLVRPVDSAVLVQGALSLWSYCSEIPKARGRAGYFAPMIADCKVAGPLLTTQSAFDTAVGRLYPLAAGVARQVSYAPGELPKYGAVGTFGIRGLGPQVVDLEMRAADGNYGFLPGKVYNLESSRFIRAGGGLSGAHSDIAHPEVAHAVWQAAATL